jgi:hypothetical protein
MCINVPIQYIVTYLFSTHIACNVLHNYVVLVSNFNRPFMLFFFHHYVKIQSFQSLFFLSSNEIRLVSIYRVSIKVISVRQFLIVTFTYY